MNRAKGGAGRSIRPAPLLVLAALLASAGAASPALAQNAPAAVTAALKAQKDGSKEVRAFYEARGYRPLWLHGGRVGPAALHLLDIVDSAYFDGLEPRRLKAGKLDSALSSAESGSPRAIAEAELLLSEVFADYVKAVRRASPGGMRYESEALAPAIPTTRAALDAAAAAPSLDVYLQTMGWMHPLYAELRRALARPGLSPESQALLRLNLERARAIPAHPSGRHVLIDAAGARLFMYENGRVRDSMRVVVGKADQQTPMMAGFIRYAILNPYWNVPPDLVPSKIAPGVLKQGPAYLRANRYEVLSDWSDKARVLDPAKVDWRAAAAGRTELRVRQLPGKSNSMGNVKFMFPNDLGIYLHDTPDKHLMREAGRQFSSGCVRLEDAARFGRWLFGKPLVAPSRAPEQNVMLPEPVPVYITYLTAAPENGTIAFRRDVYGRDASALALLRTRSRGTR
jgi:murein L,D-transpeptidase YcbB/YkuD